MAEVQIRRGRIEARLDAQRASRCKPLLQFVFKQQFMGAALDLGQRILMCHFSHIRYQFKFRKKPSYRSFPFPNHSSGEFYRLIFCLPPISPVLRGCPFLVKCAPIENATPLPKQLKEARMLTQSLLNQERKTPEGRKKLRWFITLSTMPLLGMVTAFGLVPQSDLGLNSTRIAIEQIALPKVAPSVNTIAIL